MPINDYREIDESVNDLRKFCERYRAYARQGKPVTRGEPISHKMWDPDSDFKKIHFNTFNIDTIDLNIAEDDFKRLLSDLAEMDSEEYNEYVRLRKGLGEHFILDFYEHRRIQEREQQIRKDNPSVQKAWEEYQLLLKLSDNYSTSK